MDLFDKTDYPVKKLPPKKGPQKMKLVDKLLGDTYAKVNFRTAVVRLMARGTKDSISEYLREKHKGKFLSSLVLNLGDALFWQTLDTPITEWIGTKLRQFSGTPIVIEHGLIKELRTIKEAIEKSPVALSVVYLVHGEPGTGKSYAAMSLGCVPPVDLLNDKRGGVCFDDDESPEVSEYAGNTMDKFLIDEVDLLIKDDPNFLCSLLRFLDAQRQKKSLIVLTTNDLGALPEKLLRKGRISKVVKLGPWGRKEAVAFCEAYDMPLSEAPSRRGKVYYVGDLIEWYQETMLKRLGINGEG